jgi:hypothetical protein
MTRFHGSAKHLVLLAITLATGELKSVSRAQAGALFLNPRAQAAMELGPQTIADHSSTPTTSQSVATGDPILAALRATEGSSPKASLNSSAERADIVVEGDIKAIHLKMNGVRLREVIATLARHFDITVEGSRYLRGKCGGEFNGTLESIITHLLQNENFIMNMSRYSRSLQIFSRPGVSQDAEDWAKDQENAATSVNSATSPMSPEAQQMAKQAFGPQSPAIQVEEKYFRAYMTRAMRGNTRRSQMLAQ